MLHTVEHEESNECTHQQLTIRICSSTLDHNYYLHGYDKLCVPWLALIRNGSLISSLSYIPNECFIPFKNSVFSTFIECSFKFESVDDLIKTVSDYKIATKRQFVKRVTWSFDLTKSKCEVLCFMPTKLRNCSRRSKLNFKFASKQCTSANFDTRTLRLWRAMQEWWWVLCKTQLLG